MSKLYEEIMELKFKINHLLKESSGTNFYNPWELVVRENSAMDIIWRHKKVYYKNLKNLFDIVKPDVSYPTFTKYLKDEDKCE
jgi:hypothetical protein